MELSEISAAKRTTQVIFLVLIKFCLGMANGFMGIVLQDLMCLMKVDLAYASSILTSYGSGKFLAAVLGILLGKRMDLTSAMTLAQIVSAAGFLGIPYSTFLTLTCALYFIIGFSVGVANCASTVQIGVLLPEQHYGYLLQSTVQSLGVLGSSVLANLLVDDQDMQTSAQIAKVQDNLCGHSSLYLKWMFSIPSLINVITAIGLIWSYHAIVKDGVSLDAPTVKRATEEGKKSPDVVLSSLFLLMFGFSCCGQAVVINLVITYGTRSSLLVGAKTMTQILGAYSISHLVGRLCFTFIPQKVPSSWKVFFCVLFMAGNSTLYLVFRDSNINVFWAIYVAYGFASGPLYPCLYSWARIHRPLTPSFVSSSYMLVSAGALIFPPLTGVSMDRFGNDMFMYVLVFISFVEAILFGLTWAVTKKIQASNNT